MAIYDEMPHGFRDSPLISQLSRSPQDETMTPKERSDRRRSALKIAGVGAAVSGAGWAIGQTARGRMERKKLPTSPFSLKTYGSARRNPKAYAGFLAGSALGTGLSGAGTAPMAYGAYNAIKPHRKIERFDTRRDLVDPTIGYATGRNQAALVSRLVDRNPPGVAKKPESTVAKYAELPTSDEKELAGRKRTARGLAYVTGTTGLTALALTAPQGAKMLRRSKRPLLRGLGENKTVRRLASYEPRTTPASQFVATTGAGIGGVGSFNFARMQGLEAKREQSKVTKSDDKGRNAATGAAAGAPLAYGAYMGAGHGARVALKRQAISLTAEQAQVLRTHQKKTAKKYKVRSFAKLPNEGVQVFNESYPKILPGGTLRQLLARTHGVNQFGRLAVPVAVGGAAAGAGVGLGKSIDYDRVSPGAQDAHRNLSSGRRQQAMSSVISGVTAAALGATAADAFVNRRTSSHAGKATGVLAAVTALSMIQNAQNARRLDKKVKRIERKAAERESAGVYGRDRGLFPYQERSGKVVTKALSSKELARAKARARAAGRPYPNAYDNMVAGGMKVEKGLRPLSIKPRRVTMRAGGLVSRNGQQFTRRGSLG